eukprot:6201402-Pleurochrysis_carterae.AAC.1
MSLQAKRERAASATHRQAALLANCRACHVSAGPGHNCSPPSRRVCAHQKASYAEFRDEYNLPTKPLLANCGMLAITCGVDISD